MPCAVRSKAGTSDAVRHFPAIKPAVSAAFTVCALMGLPTPGDAPRSSNRDTPPARNFSNQS
jgi:hypothetical protein